MPKTSQAPPRGGFHFPPQPLSVLPFLCTAGGSWIPGNRERLHAPRAPLGSPGPWARSDEYCPSFGGVGATCFLPLTRPCKVRLELISGLIWVLLGDEMDTDGWVSWQSGWSGTVRCPGRCLPCLSPLPAAQAAKQSRTDKIQRGEAPAGAVLVSQAIGAAM